MPGFSLSKWYLDYVTDAGDVAIAYTGAVQWGPVALHYSSILRSKGEHVTQQQSLRSLREPESKGGLICWSSKVLNFACAWNARAQAIRETIYDSKDGSVEWHCLMPLASAESNEQTGLGYVEHLRMTIPPWKIPIKTLRWGRFSSATDYVTWIDWEGEYSRRIVYMNGEMVTLSNISDDRLEGKEMRLLLDCSLVLRDGTLGSAALSGVPGIRKTFPARLLQIEEHKWRSRSRLERKGSAPVEGWTIHEKVNWPA